MKINSLNSGQNSVTFKSASGAHRIAKKYAHLLKGMDYSHTGRFVENKPDGTTAKIQMFEGRIKTFVKRKGNELKASSFGPDGSIMRFVESIKGKGYTDKFFDYDGKMMSYSKTTLGKRLSDGSFSHTLIEKYGSKRQLLSESKAMKSLMGDSLQLKKMPNGLREYSSLSKDGMKMTNVQVAPSGAYKSKIIKEDEFGEPELIKKSCFVPDENSQLEFNFATKKMEPSKGVSYDLVESMDSGNCTVKYSYDGLKKEITEFEDGEYFASREFDGARFVESQKHVLVGEDKASFIERDFITADGRRFAVEHSGDDYLLGTKIGGKFFVDQDATDEYYKWADEVFLREDKIEKIQKKVFESEDGFESLVAKNCGQIEPDTANTPTKQKFIPQSFESAMKGLKGYEKKFTN